MSSAARRTPAPMTVAEFLDWEPAEHGHLRWQLRDGVPELMAPTSNSHAAIQGELHRLIQNHLLSIPLACRSLIAPGVKPAPRTERNLLSPDVVVTCAPDDTDRWVTAPLILIEVLSPSNETASRANAEAYRSLPSAMEILLVHGTRIGAELMRRGADGMWPQEALPLADGDVLRLEVIGFSVPLRDAYRFSRLSEDARLNRA